MLKHMFIFSFLFAIKHVQSDETSVKQKFESAEIVPDVIDVAPTEVLYVKYHSKTVKFGNELTPKEASDQPSVRWPARANKYYSLVMVNPYLPPETQTLKNINHWLVGNIRGTNISTGLTIADYRRPTPPPNTGSYSYIFLVYKQNGILNFDSEPRSPKDSEENRINFTVRSFVSRYCLGNPLAGNYFIVQS